jgi:hypothetical protein
MRIPVEIVLFKDPKLRNFFPVGMRMEEKVLPKEVWGWG